METKNPTHPALDAEKDVQSGFGQTMAKAEESPLNQFDLLSCTLRFFSAAFFGIFIDIVILTLYGIAVLMGYRPGSMGLFYTLIEVPVIWGILGIFFFNEMIDLADEIVERFFLLWR